MQVSNFTPFAHLTYANEDRYRRLFDVLIVKASYNFDAGWNLVRAREQEPLSFTDTCFGEVNLTSIRQPSDLVPYKPVTDIHLLADAYAPGGVSRRDWVCGIEVGDDFSRRLRVHGPRRVEPRWPPAMPNQAKQDPERARALFRGWTMEQAEPTDRVALRWENAFGGMVPDGADGTSTDERNPLGRGWLDRRNVDLTETYQAPQIEPVDTPYEPEEACDPAGFGPIPPAWLPRRPLGGTYDQDWIDTTWPHWASDYDFAFHNSAAPGMATARFLQGGERIALRHLRPELDELSFALPDDRVLAHLRTDTLERTVALNLDTLYLDLLPSRPEDCLVTLTWRMPFLDADIEVLEIDSTATANPQRGQGDGIEAERASHPHDLFPDPAEPKEAELV